MKNNPIKTGPVAGSIPALRPDAPVATPPPKDQSAAPVDPSIDAPLGAHTGSAQAPLVGQEAAEASARLHDLSRRVPERRTGKRTSALKTRSFQDVQRQLRKPAVRQHFKDLAAAVKASPALQSAKTGGGEGQS